MCRCYCFILPLSLFTIPLSGAEKWSDEELDSFETYAERQSAAERKVNLLRIRREALADERRSISVQDRVNWDDLFQSYVKASRERIQRMQQDLAQRIDAGKKSVELKLEVARDRLDRQEASSHERFLREADKFERELEQVMVELSLNQGNRNPADPMDHENRISANASQYTDDEKSGPTIGIVMHSAALQESPIERIRESTDRPSFDLLCKPETNKRNYCGMPNDPHRFTPNGCTMVPDFDFRDCCDLHDLNYAIGGDAAAKSRADQRLRKCIKDRGYPVLGELYYRGVQLFGDRYFNWESP